MRALTKLFTRKEVARPVLALADATWLTLVGPAVPFNAHLASEVLSALLSLGEVVRLEIHAAAQQVRIGVHVNSFDQDPTVVERAIRGASNWDIVHEPPPRPAGALRLVGRLSRGGAPSWMPFRDGASSKDTDPLGAILESVQPLEDEQLLVRYLVRPIREAVWRETHTALTQPADIDSLADLLAALAGNEKRAARYEPRLQRLFEERLDAPVFEMIGVVALAGSDAGKLASRFRSVAAAFHSRTDLGSGGLTLSSYHWRADASSFPIAWPPGAKGALISPAELANLWHAPTAGMNVPGLRFLKRASLPLPHEVRHATGLLLGMHHYRGEEQPVHLPIADIKAGPVAILGKTGSGKSNMLHSLVRQLAHHESRPSIVVIDPHWDLVRDIARSSIPGWREKDTFLFELGDTSDPIGLPLFTPPPNVPLEEFADSTFALLRTLFAAQWSPTRMEDAIYALCAALCATPGATVLDIARLFQEDGYRRRVVASLTDPLATEFWEGYEQLAKGAKAELTRPILYRMRRFYRAPGVRNIIARTDGPDFGELLDRGSILLFSLAGSAIQSEQDGLAELILTRLQLALQARLARGGERRHTCIFLDESQRYTGLSLPMMLRESRKQGVSLFLSTQNVSAWSQPLAQAVLGNAGATLAFRSSPEDSRLLRETIKPFTPETLIGLNRYEALAALQVNGATTVVDLHTIAVDQAHDEDALARIREATHQRFGRSKAASVGALPLVEDASAPLLVGDDDDE